MLILYIAYVDMNGGNSGSGVRPQKMYEAFLREGHEVKLLSGSQQRWDREKRTASAKEISRWLDTNRPDICYIESPSNPILFRCDIALIRKIHRHGIPIGYFYRDFYYKFPELYPPRKDPVGRLKELWLGILQKRTDRTIRCADIVYFPSQGSTELYSYADMRPLSPAGEDHLSEVLPQGRISIYVGGISGDYGGGKMLEAFRLLNEGDEMYPLLLVCRENEWQKYADEWEREPWLEVHHVSGDDLLPLYRSAAIAVLPIEKNRYTDFSVNVKLFEYMSYGLPVAATSVREIGRIIRENGIGRADAEDAVSLAREIREMLADESAMAQWRANGEKALREKHLWIHRAGQVVRELKEKRV